MQQAGLLGLTVTEVYELDVKKLYSYLYGATLRREQDYNNELALAYGLALKIAGAVWGSKDAKKPFKNVSWADDVMPDRHKRKINKAQKQTLERIKKQYGVDLEAQVKEN